MNAIEQNTLAFPDRRAKSGVLRQRYSNTGEEDYTDPAGNDSPKPSASGTSGGNALGWVEAISGVIGKAGDIANGIIGNINQGKYGTDAYNNAQAARYKSENQPKTKNTGLIVAIVVVAVLMVVGFGILIAKK